MCIRDRYDEDDRHFTTVIPTTVHIGEEDSPLGTPGRYGLFVALMVLIVLFIAAQFTRRGAKG
ncbi:MAG: hypothetical protein N2Z74_00500, partial [Syntrophales bacterium]|nr:hypothetical protein [Syntrophales bacterium]